MARALKAFAALSSCCASVKQARNQQLEVQGDSLVEAVAVDADGHFEQQRRESNEETVSRSASESIARTLSRASTEVQSSSSSSSASSSRKETNAANKRSGGSSLMRREAHPGGHGAAQGNAHPGANQETDEPETLSVNDALVVLSRLFVTKRITEERDKHCPADKSDWSFEVKEARSHLIDGMVVEMTLKFVKRGHILPGVKVYWRDTNQGTGGRGPSPEDREALQWAKLQMQRKHMHAEGAAVVAQTSSWAEMGTPVPACSWPAQGPPPDSVALVATKAPRPLGILVEKELEAYRSGLLKQKKTEAATLPAEDTYPHSWNWRTERPECLDYVHDQGECGGCFMFAGLDSISDRSCINAKGNSMLGKHHHLSVHRALLCDPEGRQCDGGWAELAFNYTILYHNDIEAAWPFSASCFTLVPCELGAECHSPHHKHCPNLFTPQEASGLDTNAAARNVLLKKCAPLEMHDECGSWAKRLFKSDTEAFHPTKEWCEEATAKFQGFGKGGEKTLVRNSLTATSAAAGTTEDVTSDAVQVENDSTTETEEESNWFTKFWKWLFKGTPLAGESSDESGSESDGAAAPSPKKDQAPASSAVEGHSTANHATGSSHSQQAGGPSPAHGPAPSHDGPGPSPGPAPSSSSSHAPTGPAPSPGHSPASSPSPQDPAPGPAPPQGPAPSKAPGPASAPPPATSVGDHVIWLGPDEADVSQGELGVVTSVAHGEEHNMYGVRFGGVLRSCKDTELQLAPADQTESYMCDPKRCEAESPNAVHTISTYRWVPNTVEEYMHELYNEGPMYTSFWVYEDFVYFFQTDPLMAYNRKWGPKLGGHAVVLVGWEGECEYHADDDQREEGDKETDEDLNVDTHMDSTRRRTTTGKCWQLRNSWSDLWADEGYFKMALPMLTGPEGKSLHISTMAGNGAKTLSENHEADTSETAHD